MNYAVFFDLETGGVREDAPNIQIAAIAVDGEWNEQGTFERKITFNPDLCDAEALKVNGWTTERWQGAVTIGDAMKAFVRFIEPFHSLKMVSRRTGRSYRTARLVGHNAATFDGPRLFRQCKALDIFLPADPRVRCTAQRAMWYFDESGAPPPADYKLTTLCQHFGIPVVDAHDALGDVRMNVALARKLKEVAQWDNRLPF